MFFKRVYRMADTWIPVDSEPLITVVCADFLQVFWIASYMQKKITCIKNVRNKHTVLPATILKCIC